MTIKCLRIGCSAIAIAVLVGCSSDPEPSAWRQTFGKVYCYRTLADPECYAQPQPGAERRLIAVAPNWSYAPK